MEANLLSGLKYFSKARETPNSVYENLTAHAGLMVVLPFPVGMGYP